MNAEVNPSIINKSVEIFCGTGGVGKTTVATSRAIYLASINKKVLLVTIDPAKRLKDILNLSDKDAGNVETINLSTFDQNLTGKMDALLMNPQATIRYIAKSSEINNILENNIIKTLTKPYGGMNEILSIVELRRQLNTNNYDTIVLDTPPGKHFIDFLNSCEKINLFFDNSFIDLFKYLKKPTNAPVNIFSAIVSTGAKKLLGYLEKFTGKIFVEQFIEAVQTMHAGKKIFIDAVSFSNQLKDINVSNWFLVTSADHCKSLETASMRENAKNFFHKDNFIVLNKSAKNYFSSFKTFDPDNDITRLIKSTIDKETLIYKDLSDINSSILRFDEVLAPSPIDHVTSLMKQW